MTPVLTDLYHSKGKRNLGLLLGLIAVILLAGGERLAALGFFFGFLAGWLNLLALQWSLGRALNLKGAGRVKIYVFLSYTLRWLALGAVTYGVISAGGRKAGIAFLLGLAALKPLLFFNFREIRNIRKKEVDEDVR
ncbi:MAG: ATP synthase subunit I [Bacillota bacterium]